MKSYYALFENGLIHTDGLTLAEANEMLERYTRIFPDIPFHIQQLEKGYEYGRA